MIWINLVLALGIGLMLPVYRHVHRTYQSIQTAQTNGMWAQIPTRIPMRTEYIDILLKQAKRLSLKFDIQGTTIKLQSSECASIYIFLHCMMKLPTLQVESLTMEQGKGRVVAIIKTNMINGSSITGFALIEEKSQLFYTPGFSYVNAAAEVDGQKQIWVNGENYGPVCPWPLYHTFDRQTNTVKKGDLRPRLSLTSET